MDIIYSNLILKIFALIIGLAFGVMGFFLFIRKNPEMVEVETTWGKIRGKIPGVFFIAAASVCLFYGAQGLSGGKVKITKPDGTEVEKTFVKTMSLKKSPMVTKDATR